MQLEKYLMEWTKALVQHMDAFEKSIVEMKKDGKRLYVTHKKKEQIFLMLPELDNHLSDVLEHAKNKETFISIVTLNTKDNLDKLVKCWAKLSEYPRIKIFFINPYSETERKWVICPFSHSRISDDNNIKAGLLSLFQTVEPVTEDVKRRMEKEGF
ncbi:MAG: hypothetical protein QXK37_03210 [Candidatus Woesearchaeota archaeon]